MPRVVKSFSLDEDDIILGIMDLHNRGKRFDLDPCYSRGSIYKGFVPAPRIKADIQPLDLDVETQDVVNMRFRNNSLNSIIFDPPFMFNPHGTARDKSRAGVRFTMFDTWNDLVRMYCGALKEFKRVLVPGGIVAFKCQDYTDSTTTMTHCMVWKWALDEGFYPKDLFIRARDHGPAYNPRLTQRHARKFHSYWWVFAKP